jgi:hypothetical protein
MYGPTPTPHRSSTFGAALAGSFMLALFACDAPIPTAAPEAPEPAISDGAHGSVIQQFFFLAPAVPDPRYRFVGGFDGSLSPVVEICRWENGSCAGPLVARYTTRGHGPERVRVSMEDEHYIVNWRTKRYNVANDVVYRVRVLADGYQLGYMDVVPVQNPDQARRHWDELQYVIIRNGRTLPIKFRIEEGARIPAAMVGNYYSTTFTSSPGYSAGFKFMVQGARICLAETGRAQSVAWGYLYHFNPPAPDEPWGNDPGLLTCGSGDETWAYRVAENDHEEFGYEIHLNGEFAGYWDPEAIVAPAWYAVPDGVYRKQ